MAGLLAQPAIGDLQAAMAAGVRVAEFIHRRTGLAQHIVRVARTRLEPALVAQDKRLYYRGGKTTEPKSLELRSKVRLGEEQLLQLLIYEVSEWYEKAQEDASLEFFDAELLVIRFVKQLMQLTMRRNAFYVLIAVGRILFEFSTRELMILHDYLYPGPELIKDECYYRSRKSLLIAELSKRFGARLERRRESRGDIRFSAVEETGAFRAVAVRALTEFTLWGSPCLDAAHEGACFAITGDHETEIMRMHALVHPPCFQLLCSRLGLPSPALRLRVPKFGSPVREYRAA
jgi:hypothetical protein